MSGDRSLSSSMNTSFGVTISGNRPAAPFFIAFIRTSLSDDSLLRPATINPCHV